MDTPDAYGSLFDGALGAETSQFGFEPSARAEPKIASRDEWGFEATLNEEPEPALPTTDGAEEDKEASVVAARLARRLASPGAQPYPGADREFFEAHPLPQPQGFAQMRPEPPAAPRRAPAPPQRRESAEERGRRLLAYVDASLAGHEVPGPNPFAHLDAGVADNEIAAAAANYAATKASKVALKTYDLAERNEIINEGEGIEASNLDRLDITGTHYEALEAASTKREAVTEDEDMWMLDGDPNDF